MRSYTTIFFLGSILLGVLSCSSSSPSEQPPFACSTAGCPSGHCNLKLSLHTDCKGVVDYAEVLLDQALEPTLLNYGQTFVSQGDIPVGPGHTYYVRSEDIQWGPLVYKCIGPNSGSTVTLSCCPEDNKELCN